MLNITRPDVLDKNVTFNWNSLRIDFNCTDVHPQYTILSSNCGSCPTTTTNTTVTCTDVPTDGGVCAFAVETKICDHNINGSYSNTNLPSNASDVSLIICLVLFVLCMCLAMLTLVLILLKKRDYIKLK